MAGSWLVAPSLTNRLGNLVRSAHPPVWIQKQCPIEPTTPSRPSQTGTANRESCLEVLGGSSLTEWVPRGGTLEPPRSGAMSTSPPVSFSQLVPGALSRNRVGSWIWLGIQLRKLVRERLRQLPALRRATERKSHQVQDGLCAYLRARKTQGRPAIVRGRTSPQMHGLVVTGGPGRAARRREV